MKPLSTKKRLSYFIVCAILFFLAIPVVILYSIGYRIDGTFSTFRTGGVFIQTSFSDADISLDGVFKKSTNIFQKNIFLDNLKPGKYTIEVKKEGYQSWKEHLSISAEQVAQASVFILSENPVIVEIPRLVESTSSTKVVVRKANPLYDTAQSLFIAATSTHATSTATTTKIFQKISVSHDSKTVTALWTGLVNDAPYNFCLLEKCLNKIVLNTPFVHTIDFYPGRSDVVVIADGTDIYAQQIDARDLPARQNIYHGKSPDFRFDGEMLYVRDNGQFFTIEL